MAKKIRKGTRTYSTKLKNAAHLLFFKHHRLPGVRGWELKKELGNEWIEVLDVLDSQLKPLDLKVTKVLDDPDNVFEPTRKQLEDSRFYITLKGTVEQKMAKSIGWRIDDIAGLAVALAYLMAKQGKAMRLDVENVLKEKLPGWKVKINLDKYIEQGYLGEEEKGSIYIDWRSRAEIDQKKLIDLIIGFRRKNGG